MKWIRSQSGVIVPQRLVPRSRQRGMFAMGPAFFNQNAAASTYQATVLADNPILFYMLNDTSGTTAANLGSLSGANATYYGGYTQNVSSGNVGIPTCVSLNGSTGYLLTGSINPYGSATGVSVEIWVNPSSIGSLSRITDIYNRLSLQLETNGTVTGIFNGAAELNSGTAISHGSKLLQLLYTAGPSGQIWYINGSQVASNSTAYSNSAPSGGYYIGEYSSNGYFFSGDVAAHSVYQSVLSASRVLAHYNAGK